MGKKSKHIDAKKIDAPRLWVKNLSKYKKLFHHNFKQL